MEVAQNTTEADGQERRNFMKRKRNISNLHISIAQFENPLEKREQFAVSLRKKKTQEIVKAKRRKIIEAQSKMPGSGKMLEVVADNEITIQEMENQFYQGYPKWRKDEYKEQKQILERLISSEELEQYNSSDNVSNVFDQFLVDLVL